MGSNRRQGRTGREKAGGKTYSPPPRQGTQSLLAAGRWQERDRRECGRINSAV